MMTITTRSTISGPVSVGTRNAAAHTRSSGAKGSVASRGVAQTGSPDAPQYQPDEVYGADDEEKDGTLAALAQELDDAADLGQQVARAAVETQPSRLRKVKGANGGSKGNRRGLVRKLREQIQDLAALADAHAGGVASDDILFGDAAESFYELMQLALDAVPNP